MFKIKSFDYGIKRMRCFFNIGSLFSRTPVDQEVESGSTVRISCQIRGGVADRQAEIFWSKDGVRIVSSSQF